MKADIALVSCVKMKAGRSMPAKDLYISPWFRLARAYVEKNAKEWLILSAAHGLVHPDTIIEPYDVTLNNRGVVYQREWMRGVHRQLDLREHVMCGSKAIILAGLNYRRGLISRLEQMYGEVEVPMEGLMMGQQLSWLSRNA